LLFFKAKKSIGLDIGTHSVKAVQMSRRGGRLCVDEVGYALIDRNQVNADPVVAHATAVTEALSAMNLKSSQIIGALPGQTVVIRYPRYAGASRDQLHAIVNREAGQNIPYDLNEVSLDWTLLDEVEEGGQKQLKVLLVAAKHEIIDSRVQIMDASELEYSILGGGFARAGRRGGSLRFPAHGRDRSPHQYRPDIRQYPFRQGRRLQFHPRRKLGRPRAYSWHSQGIAL